jgi:hypothetical protein
MRSSCIRPGRRSRSTSAAYETTVTVTPAGRRSVGHLRASPVRGRAGGIGTQIARYVVTVAVVRLPRRRGWWRRWRRRDSTWGWGWGWRRWRPSLALRLGCRTFGFRLRLGALRRRPATLLGAPLGFRPCRRALGSSPRCRTFGPGGSDLSGSGSGLRPRSGLGFGSRLGARFGLGPRRGTSLGSGSRPDPCSGPGLGSGAGLADRLGGRLVGCRDRRRGSRARRDGARRGRRRRGRCDSCNRRRISDALLIVAAKDGQPEDEQCEPQRGKADPDQLAPWGLPLRGPRPQHGQRPQPCDDKPQKDQDNPDVEGHATCSSSGWMRCGLLRGACRPAVTPARSSHRRRSVHNGPDVAGFRRGVNSATRLNLRQSLRLKKARLPLLRTPDRSIRALTRVLRRQQVEDPHLRERAVGGRQDDPGVGPEVADELIAAPMWWRSSS